MNEVKFLDLNFAGTILLKDFINRLKILGKDMSAFSEEDENTIQCNLMLLNDDNDKVFRKDIIEYWTFADLIFRMSMCSDITKEAVNKLFDKNNMQIQKYSKELEKCLLKNKTFINPIKISTKNFKLFCILYTELAEVYVPENWFSTVSETNNKALVLPENFEFAIEVRNLISKLFAITKQDDYELFLRKLVRDFLLDGKIKESDFLRCGYALFFEVQNDCSYKNLKMPVLTGNAEQMYNFSLKTYKEFVRKYTTKEKQNCIISDVKKYCLRYIHSLNIDISYPQANSLLRELDSGDHKLYLKILRMIDLRDACVKIPITPDSSEEHRLLLQDISVFLSLYNLSIADFPLNNKDELMNCIASYESYLTFNNHENKSEKLNTVIYLSNVFSTIFNKQLNMYVNNCKDILQNLNMDKGILDKVDMLIRTVDRLERDLIAEKQIVNELKAKDSSNVFITKKIRKEFKNNYDDLIADKDKTINNLYKKIKSLECNQYKQEVNKFQDCCEILDAKSYSILIISNKKCEEKIKSVKLQEQFKRVDFLDGNVLSLNLSQKYFEKYDFVLKHWDYVGHGSDKYRFIAEKVTNFGYITGTNIDKWIVEIKQLLERINYNGI